MSRGHNRPCSHGTPPREKRLVAAKIWLPTYTGQRIVSAYKKRYGVDQLTAMREVQELCVDLSPEYVQNATAAELRRIELLPEKRTEKMERTGTMKNHVWSEGRLLQTNKRFSDLKERQKTWIYDVTREEHQRYIEGHGRVPMHHAKDDVIHAVQRRLDEREIWLPGNAARSTISKYIDRLNRRYSE